jgi:hypothetical protein
LNLKERYSIIDHPSLLLSLNILTIGELRDLYPKWIDDTIASDQAKFEEKWSQSIAVGSGDFINEI